MSSPRQRGLCADHPERPGSARVHDGSGFLGLPPLPSYIRFKHPPCVKSFIFLGILTATGEVRNGPPTLLPRKRVQRGEGTCPESPSRKQQSWRVLFARPVLECGSAQRSQALGRGFRSLVCPTSLPRERPTSCKVSRVWLQGVSRACSGLVSGLVGWQKARHLVTRHSVPRPSPVLVG